MRGKETEKCGGASISILLEDISSSCFRDGGSFLLYRMVEGSAFWRAAWISEYCHLLKPTKAFFSPVVCRHPKAASKTRHAQTSGAHPPTLGQAEVSASSRESQSWLPALTQCIGCGYTGKLQIGEMTKFCSHDGYHVPRLPPTAQQQDRTCSVGAPQGSPEA